MIPTSQDSARRSDDVPFRRGGALSPATVWFRDACASTADAMALVDAEGNVVAANAALRELLGFSDDEIRTRQLRDLAPPAEFPAFTDAIAQVIGGRTPLLASPRRMLHHLGHPIDCTATVTAGRGADGTTFGALLHLVPAREPRFGRDTGEFLTEALQSLMTSRDVEGVVRSVPRLAVPRLGDWCTIELEAGGPIATRMLEVVAADPELQAAVLAMRRQYPVSAPSGRHPASVALRTGHPSFVADVTPTTLRRLASDADHLALLERLAPRSILAIPLLLQGRVVGSVTLATQVGRGPIGPSDLRAAFDLTTSAAMALENAFRFWHAEAAGRARSVSLGAVAHDMANAVGAIAEWSARLLEGSEGARRRAAIAIQDGAGLLDRLVADLRGELSAAGPRLHLRPEPVTVDRLVAVAAELAEASLLRRELSLELDAEAAGRVRADPPRIQQALGNLIEVAAAAEAPGSTIAIEVRQVAEEVRFTVRPAPGPAEAARDAGVAGHPIVGEGPGLAVARAVIEEHGGRVEALGATTSFTLPLSDPPPRRRSAAAALPRADADHPPRTRVLVSAEHPLRALALAAAVGEDAGMRVIGTVSGMQRTVEAAGRLRPQAVIVDVGASSTRGSALIRALEQVVPDAAITRVSSDAELQASPPSASAPAALRVGESPHPVAPIERLGALLGDGPADPGGASVRDASVDGSTIAALGELSRRERDVLALTARGFTAVETGERLFLSPKTVETYRSRTMRKLGLETRAELVHFALRAGLLSGASTP